MVLLVSQGFAREVGPELHLPERPVTFETPKREHRKYFCYTETQLKASILLF